MIINCPECGKEISDKAAACPNCGCPSSEWAEKQFCNEDIKEGEEEKNKSEKEKYWCENCYRQNKIGSKYCIYCGNRLSQYYNPENSILNKGEKDEAKTILDICHKYSKSEKIKAIKELRQILGYDLNSAKKIVDEYFEGNERKNSTSYSPNKQSQTSPLPETYGNEFHGIYRFGLFGGKTEVYCPRCGSENCSYYQEQKIIPGKTKTRYTANLNPLRPFTLVNKKEKVIRKEEVATETKIICNDCGYTFK